MSAATEKLVAKILQLPRESRALLAEKLIESLDYDESLELSAEWRAELERRCRELDNGETEGIPAEQVFAEVEKLFE